MIPDTRSDVELNTIIARWLGWHCITLHFGKAMGYLPESKPPFDICCWHYVPNYSQSLDAVATAEDHLDTLAPATDNDAPRYRYARALYRELPPERQPFRATARQRAEALVYVIESSR